MSFSALAMISDRDIGDGPSAVIIPALNTDVDLADSKGDLSTGAFATLAVFSAAANGETTGFIGVDATRRVGSVERAMASAAGVGRVIEVARVCGRSRRNRMA